MADPIDGRLRAWSRSVFAALVVLALAALGVANIVQRARWHQVEDGVFWSDRAEGVIAAEVAPDSPAANSGIQKGDVLLAVNGAAVQTREDVLAVERGSDEGARLSYTLVRLGEQRALD